MKRSQINRLIDQAIALCNAHDFHLPSFAYWTAQQWLEAGHEYDEIRDNMLGWDVTDYGHGKFDEIGLLLFTIRNGQKGDARYPKPYAEKLLISCEDQLSPNHFHFNKMEDIICRAGGTLAVQLWNSTPDERLADTPVCVSVDGCRVTVPAGGFVRLKPGQSITLPPRLYHAFWSEKGTGTALLGEVSMVNDDNADNRFYQPQGRFPTIEEDEPARYLLCNEYPAAK